MADLVTIIRPDPDDVDWEPVCLKCKKPLRVVSSGRWRDLDPNSVVIEYECVLHGLFRRVMETRERNSGSRGDTSEVTAPRRPTPTLDRDAAAVPEPEPPRRFIDARHQRRRPGVPRGRSRLWRGQRYLRASPRSRDRHSRWRAAPSALPGAGQTVCWGLLMRPCTICALVATTKRKTRDFPKDFAGPRSLGWVTGLEPATS